MVSSLEAVLQDSRHAFRSFRTKPRFACITVFSLALGIGVNTAIFSLVHTLLLAKLPVEDPNNLYQLMATHGTALPDNKFSYRDYEKLRDLDVFSGVVGWGDRDYAVQVNQIPYKTHTSLVTGTFYDVLGAKPALGRLLGPSDDTNGGSAVAVIGYDFWHRVFGGQSDVLGKVLTVNSVPFTVVGVMPRDFSGVEIDYPKDITVPVHAIARLEPWANTLDNPGTVWISTLVRLKPGIAMESIRPMLRSIWPQLLRSEGSMPEAVLKNQRLDIQPGRSGVSQVRSEFSVALIILMTLVVLILLITCANVTILFLTQMARRRREIAVRLSMGAGRGRLVQQSLTETFWLVALGGGLGVALAPAITNGLLLFLPPGEGGFIAFHLNSAVLLFTAGITLSVALIIGLCPSLISTRVSLHETLKETSRGSAGDRRSWFSGLVIAAQVAVCLVVVFGALLFAKSLQNISHANLGFRMDRMLLIDMSPARAGISGDRADLLLRQLVDNLNSLPGVVSASCSFLVPLGGRAWWDSAVVPGYTPVADEATTVYLNLISPNYFQTMGIPILDGRDFTLQDDKKSFRAAIVNESFARRYFRGRNVIGRTFTAGNGKLPLITNLQIIGVVGNTKYNDPREPRRELVYVSMLQGTIGTLRTIEVRVAPTVDISRAPERIREALGPMVGGLEMEIHPYPTLFERVIRRDELIAILSSTFGILALFLAALGLYGVMGNAVARRTKELGIRMALGARPGQVEILILRDALLLVLVGVAIGIPLSLVSARVAAGVLYGLSPRDPVIALMASLVLAGVGVASAWLPARRAARTDPNIALREG